jgi:hypothetical protein
MDASKARMRVIAATTKSFAHVAPWILLGNPEGAAAMNLDWRLQPVRAAVHGIAAPPSAVAGAFLKQLAFCAAATEITLEFW